MSSAGSCGLIGMAEMQTDTLDAPGATLTYDVRPGDGADGAPPLMLIGSPMDARGFVSLAARFPDRTVVTYDPRGTARSPKADPGAESTPDQHAGDVHRLIAAVGGRVDLFATSGGAINAFALVARRPEDVRTLVAHEPPASQLLPDREAALAACTDIRDTYLRAGYGPAMAKFIVLVQLTGPVPADFAASVDPDPAQFGLPSADDGRRDDPLLLQNMVSCNFYEPDIAALRAAPTRIVVAVGTESADTLAYRGGLAVAERLGSAPVVFPSHHAGFAGPEFGVQGDPDGFAARLREVLAASA
jgi:pimeloyl-ACP methyl ester carboxylesterase